MLRLLELNLLKAVLFILLLAYKYTFLKSLFTFFAIITLVELFTQIKLLYLQFKTRNVIIITVVSEISESFIINIALFIKNNVSLLLIALFKTYDGVLNKKITAFDKNKLLPFLYLSTILFVKFIIYLLTGLSGMMQKIIILLLKNRYNRFKISQLLLKAQHPVKLVLVKTKDNLETERNRYLIWISTCCSVSGFKIFIKLRVKFNEIIYG